MARVAVVTGGTRGIGRAISEGLKEAGYKVAANYGGNEEGANQFTKETGIPAYKFDVANFAACEDGVKQIAADLGPNEIGGNKSGIPPHGALARLEFGQR